MVLDDQQAGLNSVDGEEELLFQKIYESFGLAMTEVLRAFPDGFYTTVRVLEKRSGILAQSKWKKPNKSVVATADKFASSLRSGRLFSAVPHFKRSPEENESPPKMKCSLTLAILFATVFAAYCEEFKEIPRRQPLCPMVAEPQKEGLYQLIEVIGAEGKNGVAEPGENVRLKCTVVNLTNRSLMVAEDFITPQYASIEGRVDGHQGYNLDDFDADDAKRPLIEKEDVWDVALAVPNGIMDWGHIRRWIHISASHNRECGCCIRHRQYSKSIEIKLPNDDWTSITLNLTQVMPAIFLGPEKRVTLESETQIVIKRRNSEQVEDPNRDEAPSE